MRFFINRPIFAMVLSIVIFMFGFLALFKLPIAQYPEITPPTVEVKASYPGANARDTSVQVATPIEQEINGVEHMLYMESKCTNDGQMTLTVTFEVGTDLNMAQVLVQNRVNLAEPKLPDIVKKNGVNTKKKSPSIIMVVNLESEENPETHQPYHDQLRMSNYAALQIKDQLARLPGVGDVAFLGEREYSMRIWLDPDRVAQRDLTANDIAKAIQEQNVQTPAGQVGQPPTPEGQKFQQPVITRGRLTTEKQFDDIIIKSGKSGEITYLHDVGYAELGAKNSDVTATLDGKPSVALSVYQLPGSNALDTADGVRNKMEELGKRFPKGMKYRIEYDTTPFVRESIHEVVKTLEEAIILVAIVVLVFLQNWRSALIPLIAVPVSIVGTLGVMLMVGFSLNNLSMFGLVLAIGIVVDDAIVVVENVEHHMAHGMAPKEATVKAMGEVAGPVIAVALVLCAVFVPTALITGITGQFFRQFALTIAISTVISAFNSLTLSPALCPLLLKPREAKPDILTRGLNLVLGWFFNLFNRSFEVSTNGYTRSVGLLLRGSVIVLVLYVGLLGLTYFGFTRVPTGFIPQQDKGYLLVAFQLPDGASLERTQKIAGTIDDISRGTPGVKSTVGVQGMSFLTQANGSNQGSVYVILKPFADRGHGESADEVAAELRKRFAGIKGAQVGVFGAPPVDGLGNASGFKMQVQDRSSSGSRTLEAVTNDVVREANQQPGLVGVSTSYRANAPQVYLTVNEVKAKSMRVPLSEINSALQIYQGSLYVNDVTLFDKNYQVNLQAESKFRLKPEQILDYKVRNEAGEMVPLGTVVDLSATNGPSLVTRYNMFPAAAVNGATLPGVSSGDAISTMDQVCKDELPPSMGYEWTELTLLQIKGSEDLLNKLVFPLAVVLVFLVLAAQYESWAMPLAVILVVPMCLLCAIAGVALVGGDINIFTQIGFVVLVGLASKNAILIVEFAKAQREAGKPAYESTLEACRLRLRPILMTSFAFILGVVPLLLGHGAGAEMRFALGIAVFSGMLGVTIFGIFLTPVFFYVIQRLAGKKDEAKVVGAPASPDGVHGAHVAETAIQAHPAKP